MYKLILIISSLTLSAGIYAQGCCSGGAGSPLSGGASTGVLQKGKMEVAFSHQYSQSNKFLSGTRDTTRLFGRLSSNYMYLRTDYGLTDKLTLSLSAGYFLDKTLYELDTTLENHNPEDFTRSIGFGDLIIFPRYSVFHKVGTKSTTELSLGLGLKIPIGTHDDTSLVFTNPTNGQEYYATIPPTVQTTNGSNDFMFYAFFYKGFPHRKFRLFSNALYIKKGWNSLGQKFGNYASLSIFGGTTLFKGLGLTASVKGEHVARMRSDKNVNMLALYNIEEESTGSMKLSVVPQISYSFKSFSIFALADIPVYQYMNGVQIAAQYQFTGGISYRFFIKKPKLDSIITVPMIDVVDEEGIYELQEIKVWGNCEMCKDRIERTLLKIEGIKTAQWDISSKMLKVKFDNKITSLEQINEAVAKAGHDTETHKASKKSYKKLHGCCKYQRDSVN